MRYRFTIVFILIATYVQGQDLLYKKEGFAGKVKLRDIPSTYASVEITTGMGMLAGNSIKRFVFRHGASNELKNEKDFRVCDESGEVLTFSSTAEALNFFDYNGWELVQLFYGVGNGGQSILLKRKRD